MRSMKDFGRYIAERRKRANMTQETFALRLGITPQAVSKWETGIGYPDVSLFPDIARALDVSIDELFGEKRGADAKFPEKWRGMAFVAAWGERACYSNKGVESVEDAAVKFSDGSTADLETELICNRGKGEIAIFENDYSERIPFDGPDELNEVLESFESLDVNLSGNYDVEVIPSDDGSFRLYAKGNPVFIAQMEFRVENGTFFLSRKQNQSNSGGNNNAVRIYVGFKEGKRIKGGVNGSGIFCVGVDFAQSELKINGSGDIEAKNVGVLDAVINGSGDIRAGESAKASLKINGSGDISLETAVDPMMKINGAGDISIGRISGNAEVRISGAGDVRVSGEVDKLFCDIHGSGDFDGGRLKVNTAECYAEGSAEISIGHIVESSIEKLSKNSSLNVGKRGR